MRSFNLLLSFKFPKLNSSTAKNYVPSFPAIHQTRKCIFRSDWDDVVSDYLNTHVSFNVPNNDFFVGT